MRHVLSSQKLLWGRCILSKRVTALPLGALRQLDTHPEGKLLLNGEQTYSSGMTCWQSFWNSCTSVFSLQWKNARGLGIARGGGTLMERKSGTGRRPGSTPNQGKLLSSCKWWLQSCSGARGGGGTKGSSTCAFKWSGCVACDLCGRNPITKSPALTVFPWTQAYLCCSYFLNEQNYHPRRCR